MRLAIASLAACVLALALHATPCGAAAPLMPGDYNGDDEVDLDDFVEWKADFGTNLAGGTSGEPGTGADGNGDGTIDAADYTVWRDNAGRSQSVSPIPEPTAAALVGLGLATLSLVRRRRE